jgi:predicted RNA-binding Zn-ribbon protein involved in translation (DUF1610 family)
MTYKEARNEMQSYAENSWGGLNESFELAIKALEKQIPKKPLLYDCDYSYFECGNCGEAIFYTDEAKTHKYCLNCGQALDWGDTE